MNLSIGLQSSHRTWNENNAWSEPSSSVSSRGELSRLINAAVVNPAFRKLLLSRPAVALAAGYNGEPFCLAPEERMEILSAKATSLTFLARKLTDHRNGNGHG
jgi:hypothetical protein